MTAPKARRRPRLWSLVAAVCAALLASLLCASGAQAAPVTVGNGTQFATTSGDVVHAHGGGVG
ncbi:hypothetical protein [Streptomyces sparsogenes]|uniref:Uncharacterized protein n=1 Tax=Streptomyces sparsogenes DSM 40356 TaxID=1331668 RepID=A0A1R1SA31_9ACTN|nr:hypothetical protein [Streptomyces sparsogenes]OMI35037.1 hypothetical protein SPAR_33366 [Streptomyces sparsogenes DSM 40356]